MTLTFAEAISKWPDYKEMKMGRYREFYIGQKWKDVQEIIEDDYEGKYVIESGDTALYLGSRCAGRFCCDKVSISYDNGMVYQIQYSQNNFSKNEYDIYLKEAIKKYGKPAKTKICETCDEMGWRWFFSKNKISLTIYMYTPSGRFSTCSGGVFCIIYSKAIK